MITVKGKDCISVAPLGMLYIGSGISLLVKDGILYIEGDGVLESISYLENLARLRSSWNNLMDQLEYFK